MYFSGLLFFETHNITNFPTCISILGVFVCVLVCDHWDLVVWSYYKAVTSLQNLSLKIGREWGFSFLCFLLWSQEKKKKPKCSLDLLVNILCLHLNLKCMKRIRQSVKIINENIKNVMALFCCSNKMTKCNDLI